MTQDSKDLILQTAYKLFSQYGFSGTSIKMIAKEIGITTGLIFHHFGSKKELHDSAAQFATFAQPTTQNAVREDSLEHFLEDIITLRLHLYNDREFRRFFQWRSLENVENANKQDHQKDFQGNPLQIPSYIQRLQEIGLIRQDIEAAILSTLIFTNSCYAVLDYADYYQISPKGIGHFKKLALEALLPVLRPSQQKPVNHRKKVTR